MAGQEDTAAAGTAAGRKYTGAIGKGHSSASKRTAPFLFAVAQAEYHSPSLAEAGGVILSLD